MDKMSDKRILEKYWFYIEKEREIERIPYINLFFDPEYKRAMRNRQRYMREICRRNLDPSAYEGQYR